MFHGFNTHVTIVQTAHHFKKLYPPVTASVITVSSCSYAGAQQHSNRSVSLASVPQLVPLARQNGDGVADLDVAGFAINANPARAMGDVIDFLGLDVIMLLRARRPLACNRASASGFGLRMAEAADARAVPGIFPSRPWS